MLEGVEWAADSVNASGYVSELDGSNVIGMRSLGDERTIAQVHPKMLCEALWAFVESENSISSRIVKGSISLDRTKYDENINNRVTTTLQDGTILEANAVLFACGPWTEYMDCMFGVKYHSAIIPTRPRVLTQSVFFDGFGDPEVYPRPDGTAYCCGYPDPPTKVTEKPGEEEVRPEKIEEIVRGVRQCSGGKDGVLGKDPEISQSCYLPSTPDNLPIIGTLDDKNGLFCAAGHSCWGILMGPATGEAIASLMIRGHSSLDLSSFRPQRFSK
jgi:glycine/D-amino acid oxidase-like deaminating enzyme